MVKPILDRIFVEVEEQKQGAIITLEDDNEVKVGKVISKGCDVRNVKVGDRVIFFKWDDLPTPDKNITVIREKFVLGILEDGE